MLTSFKLSDWKILADEDSFDLESGQRYTFPVQIGEEGNPGEEKMPVIEDVYSDVYIGVCQGKYANVVSMGRIPAVVFKDNGRVIDHNENMEYFRDEIDRALANIPTSLRMRAMVSTATINRKATLPRNCAAMDVVTLVCNFTGTKYHADLILDVLKTSIDMDEHFQSPLKDELKSLNKNTLLELVGEIKSMTLCGETKNEYLLHLIERYGKEDVILKAAWEVADRELLFGCI